LIKGHKCGPDEKNQGNDDLGSNQKIGQDFVFEDNSFFHKILHPA
jgi:hypothetical protein